MRVANRHNLLFLGAVILPSVLVVALGLRMIRQEDVLAEQRLREQKQQGLDLVRQELLTRLEGIKLRAASGSVTPRDPEVALIARVESGKLILPWEGRRSAVEPLLGQLRDPVGARALLRTSTAASDEYGVPLAVYAARRLAAGASLELRREILDRMEGLLNTAALSPSAAHMIGEVCELLGAPATSQAAAARAREAGQAEQLAREMLALPEDDAGPVWRLFGSLPWLIGITGHATDRERTLVAVRVSPLLSAVRPLGMARWYPGGQRDGEPLGAGLPGLRIALPEGPGGGGGTGSRQVFYVSGLLLVISVTVFTAYLLHRDVRRETRLASLRSQFVSSVSHELRTPIATIRAFAELIDLGRVKSELEKAEYVKNILGESVRLSRLVADVLEFSRIEQGKRVYRLRPVPLEEVLHSAARSLAYPLSQGNFELRIAADPAVPLVAADRDALEQAVMNLLGNAIKYSGDARDIDLSLSREGNEAVIRVRDRGIGIPIEEHSRIFERFYRSSVAGAAQIPGTGLGLALVDYIVKAHGGSVAVQSRPGQGSTFSILLPIPTTT